MNVFQIFYLMIPAYLANMAPPLVYKLIPINAPMDFGLSIGKVRIFGDHKTWGGFIGGVIVAVIDPQKGPVRLLNIQARERPLSQ